MNIISKILIRIVNIISKILIRIGDLLISLGHIIVGILTFSKFAKSVHHRLGSLFPFHTREKLEKMFLYSGLTRNPEETLGITVMYSILVPITVGLITFALIGEGIISIGVSKEILSVGIAIASFILVWMIMYMILRLLIDRRTASLERVLPDLLSMIAQNMSAGMTPYNALWVAARPEFGPLALEIQKVARDTLTGTPLDVALMNMSKRVNSEKLQRTVKLMIQGMKSGGELPTVLQEMSRDIRTEQSLVRRMESETTAQVMFIMFALMFGAPLLFASSSQFIRIFSKTLSNIDVEQLSTQVQGGMIKLQPLAITESEFVLYAIAILVVCSFFGSLLIGLMRSGKMTSGLPLILITMGLSIGIFLTLRFILESFFWGMMGVGA